METAEKIDENNLPIREDDSQLSSLGQHWKNEGGFIVFAALATAHSLAMCAVADVQLLARVVVAVLALVFVGREPSWRRVLLLFTAIFLSAFVYYRNTASMYYGEGQYGEGENFADRGIGEDGQLRIVGRLVAPLSFPRIGELRLRVQPLGATRRQLLQLVGSAAPWSEVYGLAPGDLIDVQVRLARRHRQLSTYDRFLRSRGVAARGWIEGFNFTGDLGQKLGTVSKTGAAFKLAAELDERTNDSEASGVLLAATLGRGDLLAERTRQLFRRAGISHLLVVSGFHIGVVFSVCWAASFWLLCRSESVVVMFTVRKAAHLVALTCSFLYIYLLGFSVTAVRALLFLLAYVAAKLLCRSAHAPRILLAVYSLVLFYWPAALVELGSQLTFAAVTGIVVARYLNKHLSLKLPTTVSYFARSLCYCTCAWTFTAPILLVWFGTLALNTVPMNIVFCPLFSLGVICFGGIALVSFHFGFPGAEFALDLVLVLCALFLDVLEAADRLLGLPFIAFEPTESWKWATCFVVVNFLLISAVVLMAVRRSSQPQRQPDFCA